MRLILIIVIVCLAAWLVFFQKPIQVNYPAVAKDTAHSPAGLLYQVPVVHRLLGADIYRGKGIYTAIVQRKGDGLPGISLMRHSKQTGNFNSEMRLPLPAEEVDRLGIHPDFGYWEEYGKWVLGLLLFGIISLAWWKK